MSRSPLQLCLCPQPFDMPRMSLNHPIISVFWALSSLLGHCQLFTVVRDGGGREDCYCVLGTQVGPAMWQKEQGEAEKLIVGQALDCQPASAMCQRLHLLGTLRSVAVCQTPCLHLDQLLGSPACWQAILPHHQDKVLTL